MINIQGTIASEERLRWLNERLTTGGSVTIADSAEALGVSHMTIRRDLVELEERGTARRVRGGAKAVGPQTFDMRHHTSARAKSRIAAKLAEFIPESGAIALDASSTVLRLTSALRDVRDIVVLTNGPETFAALQDLPGVAPLLTGGALDQRTGSLVGPLACRAASQLSVGTFFASAAAIAVNTGALEATLEDAEVKRCLAANAERVIVGIDASKLDARGLALGIEWGQVDLLVTDLAASDERLAPFRAVVEVV